MGNVQDIHPFAEKLVLDSFPAWPRHKEPYQQYVECAAKDFDTLPRLIEVMVPPVKLHKMMCQFAAGVQYVAKDKGISLPVTDYEYHHNLKKYGMDFEKFYAAIIPDNQKMIFHPQLITLFGHQPNTEINFHRVEGTFRPDEIAVLVGAEEMFHIYQDQREGGIAPTFDLNQFSEDTYAQDPNELEATAYLQEMAQKLGLGSCNRGQHK